MKKNVLIIGAGGVAQVVAHKCAQNNDILGNIVIASRTLSKCQNIAKSIEEKNNFKIPSTIQCYALDAFDIEQTKALIEKTQSQIVINVAQSFQNMPILEACIQTGVAYIDTAIAEDQDKVCPTPPWYGHYEWKRLERCKENKITAILSAGFDPGVVNAYASYGVTLFDSVESIDIIDINAGNHGKYFATNFDPEVNFREFTGVVYSWQNNQWQTNQMFEVKRTDDLPVVGVQNSYLTGHEEVHSLAQHLDVPNIRFWMGFGDHYINVFNVLKNLGLLSEKPVTTAEGVEVVPLKVVKAVLPDPPSLAENYTGHTCIGDLIKGKKDGKDKEVFIYNTASHTEAYEEVGSQGISYTAGVPAVAAALLVATGEWDCLEMRNVEQLDPKPYLNVLNKIGLPNRIKDENGDRELVF
ncbi:saccharopine dehydrogenase family protein [Pasteurella skyensis]|uniref:Saccharopine dehydrogenase family protein n=1 Tax=Phocoenobacter skyensis TaxID=97481 RepID=A0AAJ6N9V8_9PAST|nr:saccharopine dehydrogenase family protein [Pasteurella skyensis]MDP8162968.1 saccharopine dehydrogenase family protein [Pasteurella skyensis]MDP8172880.1 saccharopine dehydrogenase family protein [Pasteurella skyensis]MDP8176674.1 saccharopine dehydrogenase family protein [Pasteurella skyensis]MDP8179380.1 saccharopine dehydrogenase family protein [Pasteurella skyensis]MDP8183578.1 saccharopine dehydrogenase family protein [Pasteurella skyensis]